MGEKALKQQKWTGCYADSWKGVITDAAFAHPAKFSKALIERILDYMAAKRWIKKGDVIGDPFGGVGTGGIVAAYRGYQWIGEELEAKFHDLACGNFVRHASKWMALGVPLPVIVQGDSRQFNVMVNAILSSPPYVSGGHHTDVMNAPNTNGRGQKMKCHAVVTSPPYAGSLDDGGPEKAHPDGYIRSNNWTGYGKSEGQIATLKSGDVEAVVTSPPFLGAHSDTTGSGGGINKAGYKGKEKARPSHVRMGERTYQAGRDAVRDIDNIEQLDPGTVAAVISSPPYDTIHAGAGGLNHLPAKEGQQGGRKKGVSQSADQRYGDTPGQIAHTEKASIDAILSSPPYADSMDNKSHGIDFTKAKKDYPGRVNTPERIATHLRGAEAMRYGDSPGQIGQEQGETYWQAMAKVYHACLLSLKPGGYMAIVVKDFVKDKKRMPLCDDTMRLLVWLGFEEVERIHAMLTEERIHNDLFEGTTSTKTERKSFFRRLHEGKLAANDPRRIDFEEVLIVRKPL